MEIASCVFWVTIGVLYIIYQCLKEHPAETLIVIGTIVTIMICLAIIYAWSIPFAQVSPVAGWFFQIIICGVALYFLVRKKRADDKKREEEIKETIHQAHVDRALKMIATHLAESGYDEESNTENFAGACEEGRENNSEE